MVFNKSYKMFVLKIQFTVMSRYHIMRSTGSSRWQNIAALRDSQVSRSDAFLVYTHLNHVQDHDFVPHTLVIVDCVDVSSRCKR